MPENYLRDNTMSDRLQLASEHKQKWFHTVKFAGEGLKMPQPLLLLWGRHEYLDILQSEPIQKFHF